MKFTEEKAKEVIKKYRLSETTLKVWKTRGNIPGKYFKEDYKKPESLPDRIQEKVISILSSEKIQLKALAERSGISYQKLRDAMVNRSSIYKHEYIALKVALNTIRTDAKKHAEAFSSKDRFTVSESERFKKFLQTTPELVITKVFEDAKYIDWRNGKPVVMRPDDYKKAIDNLSIFILETSLPEKV